MKWLLLITIFASAQSFAASQFPESPDPTLTPGTLCETPQRRRYPERIAYCERDVSSYDKRTVFKNYRNSGYSLSGLRSDYKVDHFIPLCAGGSNKLSNLWPQHKTLYALTDPLEPLGCEVLSRGKITQKQLIELIKKAKMNPKEASGVLKTLKAMLVKS